MSSLVRLVLLAAAAAALLGVAPPPIPMPPAVKPAAQRGPSGRIVLIRAAGEFLVDARRVAEALPAARVGDGPVCLLVDDRLTAAQAHLLARVAVREIVCVGEPPEDAADLVTRRVESPRELDEPSAEAVVCSPHLGDVLAAAPLAFRRRVPLLVQDEMLADRLARLGVERVLTVGAFMDVLLPAVIDRTDLGEPAARWRALAAEGGPAPYLAVANVTPGRPWASGSPLAAMIVAARRGGMLLLLDEPVELRYAEMTRTKDPPPGLADLEAVGWLSGTLPVGDGRLDAATERVPVGDPRTIDGAEYSISSRLIGILGITKFIDAQRTNRVVAIRPAAETVARRLATLYDAAGPPSALLLAGDHREIPFDAVRDPVYAATIMHEQELASDNLYADVDGDGRLDVPVGRLVTSGPVTATATASRISAYERLGGPWRGRACAADPVWPDDETTLQIPFVFASFEAFLRGLGRDLDAAGYETRLHLREAGALEAVYPGLADSAWIVLLPHRHPDLDEPPPGGAFAPPFDGAPVVVSA
ncbi:MAG: C25 family cysteine peptidase, partial [Planctomycetota bacterium]